MALETINREEFDRRLEQSTERMRQKRLTLEARAAELENLIGQYSSVLERIGSESALGQDSSSARREELRHVLNEMAKQAAAAAAAL